MIPTRVTPPAGPVVTVADLKADLGIVGTHDDMRLAALEAAAVAHLDGWRGILGRCIMPQSWRIEYGCAGRHRLPFGDVTEVTAVDGAGDPMEVIWGEDALGGWVDLPEPGVVTMTSAMPADAVDALRDAIRIWVRARYDGHDGPAQVASYRAFGMLLGPLRRVGP